MTGKIELFFGLRESGKSLFAERRLLGASLGVSPVYVATLPHDDKYSAIIARHAARRGRAWTVVEANGGLFEQACGEILSSHLSGGVLLDGLAAHLVSLLSGPDMRIRRSEIFCKYLGFIFELRRATPRLYIVVNIPDLLAAQQFKPRNLDVTALALCSLICGILVEMGALVWLCVHGEAKRVEWSVVEQLYNEFLLQYG